jgi:multidrug efflux system membrane fusion protein
LSGSETQTKVSESTVEASLAAVERAKAAVQSAEAQKELAASNLRRIEPLLAKQYVTPEQVDEARTKAQITARSYEEAQSAVQQAQATASQARFAHDETKISVTASQARLAQSVHAVEILEYFTGTEAGQGREGQRCATESGALYRQGAFRRIRAQPQYLGR